MLYVPAISCLPDFASHLNRPARTCVVAFAGQGFSSKKPGPKTQKKSSKDPESTPISDVQAIDKALKAAGVYKAINQEQAKKGKVDFVKVKDWGSGTRENLGDLQIDETAPADSIASVESLTLHDRLARELQALQRAGRLNITGVPGMKPLPPFEEWAFKLEHYLQYLVDLHTVHKALEAALEAVTAASCISSGLRAALARYAPEVGLARAGAIARDVAALSSELPAAPAPSTSARAFASYLASLASRATAGGPGAGAAGPAGHAARLFCCAYLLHLTGLTSHVRIGAAAMEKLDLVQRGAMATFTEFPPEAKNPLGVFVDATNEAGRSLGPEEADAVASELARTMPKTSLLLQPLARAA
ncbi:hypothetical protein ACKKBF_B05330 [Auxenochlorella protothecoides x Auxenochlorella symbiontica]